jgi:ATP-dependent helicase/nuclease subunit A
VKQSIYRFRHADPTLFLHRSRTYGRGEGCAERAIFLQKNFRSNPRILGAVNAVFDRAMREKVTELDYLPEDALVPGLPVAGRAAPGLLAIL